MRGETVADTARAWRRSTAEQHGNASVCTRRSICSLSRAALLPRSLRRNAAGMPKPRHRTGANSYFAVSPWQDKQAAEGDAYDASEPAQPGYSVVEVPLGVGTAAPATTAAAAAAPAGMPAGSQPAPAAGPSAAAGGWQAKKRKPAADEAYASTAGAAEPEGGACLLAAGGGAAAGAAGGEQPPAGPGQEELEGTAYLALLPNGSVTGEAGCASRSPCARSLGALLCALCLHVLLACIAGQACLLSL